MELKYQKELGDYTIDISAFSERNVLSYRWVFEDIDDVRNFLPVYVLDIERETNDKKNNTHTCLGYAISLYSSRDLAKEKLLKITRVKKNLFKKLGNHIAEGTIEMNLGICNEPNSIGHFDLFEYKDVILNDKFNIVEKLTS